MQHSERARRGTPARDAGRDRRGRAASTASLVRAAEKPVTHTVVMKATSYAPLTLTIRRGDSVVWINQDPFPHTVTSAGAFDSKSIAAGASWKYKPRRVGEYAYTCTFHPNMKGTLRVE